MLLLFVGRREDDLSMRIWLLFKSRNKLLVAAESPESWLHKELLGLRLWLAACIVTIRGGDGELPSSKLVEARVVSKTRTCFA